MEQITAGVVGYGYWGPNIVRNFSEIDSVALKYICDLNPEHLNRHKNRYPAVRFTPDYQELLDDKSLDAIAIATPVSSHYALAKQALLAGKHVLIAKPMCKSSSECEELVAIAEEMKLTLMVDHTFVYHGPVRLMKQLISAGELGDLLYLSSVRVNLGIFQSDVNVIWDLGAHDFSIMDYLLGNKMPTALHAIGKSHTDTNFEDVVFLTLEFEDNFIAHFHVSWLSPVKIRQMLIGGTQKMLMFDDHRPIEKVCLYDKGIELSKPPQTERERYRALIQYRNGDMRAPVYDLTEALKFETLHFIDCIKNNKTPITDGRSGLRVVRLLELADASIKSRTVLPVNVGR